MYKCRPCTGKGREIVVMGREIVIEWKVSRGRGREIVVMTWDR